MNHLICDNVAMKVGGKGITENVNLEKSILKTLGRNNSSEMTKSDLIQLCTMVGTIDPEVAKHIIDQIPDFYKLLENLARDYRKQISDIVVQNDNNMKSLQHSAFRILDISRKPLKVENIMQLKSSN